MHQDTRTGRHPCLSCTYLWIEPNGKQLCEWWYRWFMEEREDWRCPLHQREPGSDDD